MSAAGFGRVKQLALAQARPLSAHLELTYACNWRCVFCYNPRHHDRERLRLADWEPVLDDLRELGTLTITLTGGEPLRHPEFFEIAEAIRARAFALKVYTNGALVDDAAADRLAALLPLSVELSLHGATAEVHDAATATPGSFAALWAGLERLQRRAVALRLKTPMTCKNEHQLDAMIRLAHEARVAYTIDPTLTPRDDGDRGPLAYAPTQDGLRRLMERLRDAGTLPGSARESGGANCGLGRMTLAIDPEGQVFPCLQWRQTSLGSVRRQRLSGLWRASPQREQAAQVATSANERLLAAGGAAASFPFCPALAFQATGDPLTVHQDFLRQAETAAAVRAASPAPHTV